MSINIHFVAFREVQVIVTGRIEKQEVHYDAWQTPTNVTLMINANSNPIQAYKDWVLRISTPIEEDVFADDDIFCETPIGKNIWHEGEEEVSRFQCWVKRCLDSGYTIRTEAW